MNGWTVGAEGEGSYTVGRVPYRDREQQRGTRTAQHPYNSSDRQIAADRTGQDRTGQPGRTPKSAPPASSRSPCSLPDLLLSTRNDRIELLHRRHPRVLLLPGNALYRARPSEEHYNVGILPLQPVPAAERDRLPMGGSAASIHCGEARPDHTSIAHPRTALIALPSSYMPSQTTHWRKDGVSWHGKEPERFTVIPDRKFRLRCRDCGSSVGTWNSVKEQCT